MQDTSQATGALPLIAPYVHAMDWADAYARAAQGWFDWHLAVWQQVFDAQAEYLHQWGEAFGGPMLQGFAPRGGEQLA